MSKGPERYRKMARDFERSLSSISRHWRQQNVGQDQLSLDSVGGYQSSKISLPSQSADSASLCKHVYLVNLVSPFRPMFPVVSCLL
jgi:hypothetical protein